MTCNEFTVNSEFGDVNILDQRKEEQVLRETEERVRKEADAQGIEQEEDVIGFEISAPSQMVSSAEDFEEYLEGCRGLQSASLLFYGGSNHRDGNGDVAESVDVKLDFPHERFLEAYRALNEEFGVRDVGFYMIGDGEDSVEAVRSAVPAVSYLVDSPDERKGADVSYRDGGTVETIWTEGDDLREVYDSLTGQGLAYEGEILTGEKDSEWVIAENLDETPR